MGPIGTDEHEQKLRTEERTLFRYMLVRLSIVSLVVGVAMYSLGTVLDQQGVVSTAVGFTILPAGGCFGIVTVNDEAWQPGSCFKLQLHKFCMTLLCALLGFDLGAFCAAIGV